MEEIVRSWLYLKIDKRRYISLLFPCESGMSLFLNEDYFNDSPFKADICLSQDLVCVWII